MAESPSAPPPPRRPKPRPEPDYEGPERRQSLAHAAFEGLPLWSRIIAMVGIPGTLVFFLVWVGADYLPKIYAELIAMRLESEKSRLVLQQQNGQLEMNYRLLQRICSNVAKNDEDRQRCFDR